MSFHDPDHCAPYYLGLAIEFAADGNFFMARSNLMYALWAAREDASSVIEEAQSWANALPVLEEVIRLNRDRLERIVEATA
ncbi:MAG: hypothetical protein CMH39_00470 [Micrococcales bacterium]|jgi:hypothetical protein|nr:hypothetical protein [Micrococcales bacterium]|tara:strand:- start:1614 stop:1856 length:243 start_codon:yes stop_codon:yes gene_type:complete